MTPRKRPKPHPAVRDHRTAPEAQNRTPGPLAFILEGNPRPKERPRVVNGRAYTPQGTLDAEGEIRMAALQAGARPQLGPVRMTARFFRGTARRCDLDNLIKTVLDGLNGTAFADDSQVVEIYAWKSVDRARPRTEVEVIPVPPLVERVATSWDGPAQIQVDEMDDPSGT